MAIIIPEIYNYQVPDTCYHVRYTYRSLIIDFMLSVIDHK